MHLSDPSTVQHAFLDEGFAANGKASGRFVTDVPESLDGLVAKFRQGHLRSRVFWRGQHV